MPQVSTPGLILVTVAYNSKPFLAVNLPMVFRKNTALHYEWLILENSPPDSPQRITEADLDQWLSPAQRSRVTFVEGVSAPPPDTKGLGSVHHGMALDKAVHVCKALWPETRWLFFLDPDFYLLQPEALLQMISSAKDDGLALLGAPYDPAYYEKWRQKPCVYALLCDQTQLDLNSISYQPKLDATDAAWLKRAKQLKQQQFPWLRVIEVVYRWFKRSDLFQNRYCIGTKLETGYQLYERYGQLPVQCFTPVFNPKTDARIASTHPAYRWDALLPNALRYVPRNKASYSTVKFATQGYPDFKGMGWEEYWWQGQPWAVHVRATPKVHNPDIQEEAVFQAMLAQLTSAVL